MAKYTPYGIYTYVRNKLLAAYPDIYVTGKDEPIPPEGVAVQIHEINHYRLLHGLTLEDLGNMWRVAFEVNVYTNEFQDGPYEAYEIMRVAEEAFEKMFFIEFDCVPITRANNRVTRIAARFERNLGFGDEMPEE